MSPIFKYLLIISAITGLSLVIYNSFLFGIEHPQYKVLSSNNNIEIRQYDPMIIAETKIKGSRKETINKGFRILADYIFGNNTMQNGNNESHKIKMTAPVQQELLEDLWHISFIMPKQYNLSTLPIPNNQDVELLEIPKQKFIVIRFSWSSSDKNILTHEKKLLSYIKDNNIEIKSGPKYAFYNPPWTLPFLKRHEVMFEV